MPSLSKVLQPIGPTFPAAGSAAEALTTLTASGGDALLIEKDGSIVGLFSYREALGAYADGRGPVEQYMRRPLPGRNVADSLEFSGYVGLGPAFQAPDLGLLLVGQLSAVAQDLSKAFGGLFLAGMVVDHFIPTGSVGALEDDLARCRFLKFERNIAWRRLTLDLE